MAKELGERFTKLGCMMNCLHSKTEKCYLECLEKMKEKIVREDEDSDEYDYEIDENTDYGIFEDEDDDDVSKLITDANNEGNDEGIDGGSDGDKDDEEDDEDVEEEETEEDAVEHRFIYMENSKNKDEKVNTEEDRKDGENQIENSTMPILTAA